MGYLKKIFGENVKLIRKSKKITQEKLAELIEIDLRQLARIEAGESFVTAETIEKLSEKLDVPYSMLFHEDKELDKIEKTTLYTIENYKNNYKRIIKNIKKIAENDKKTEFVCLAIDALDKKTSLEKLKGSILGLEIK